MNYMLDKINVYPKNKEIKSVANEILKLLYENKDLNDSEKLMTIELAVAQLNYDLYKISGDGD